MLKCYNFKVLFKNISYDHDVKNSIVRYNFSDLIYGVLKKKKKHFLRLPLLLFVGKQL